MAEELTQEQREQAQLLAVLGQLGSQRVQSTAMEFTGKKWVLPETYRGDLIGAVEFLRRKIAEEEETTQFTKTFRRRPWDGAAAMESAMKKAFGTAGLQKPTWTFFGKKPPQRLTVNAGPQGKTLQIPWGEIECPIFEGTIYTAQEHDEELGSLFRMIIECPRKYAAHVEGLFQLIEEECKLFSIYKGQAFDGKESPDFIDTMSVSDDAIIYGGDVLEQLRANLWAPLEFTQLHRDLDMPLKRAVLLGGEYGTGKTMTLLRTAKVAVGNGWTAILCRPGRDDLTQVVQTARLYQPAVVLFEDIDVLAESGDSNAVTQLLDLFDGIQSKGTELLAVLTTNHIDRIHKGMWRPGRLDAMITLGALDREGVEKLIKRVVPDALLDHEVDFDAVFEAMEGYLPAFCREATDRALRYAITRSNGQPDKLVTHDFVAAAEGLREQWGLMNEAGEGKTAPALEEAVKALFKDGVHDAVDDVVEHRLDGADIRMTNGDRGFVATN